MTIKEIQDYIDAMVKKANEHGIDDVMLICGVVTEAMRICGQPTPKIKG